DALCLFQLVLEDDDAAGILDLRALVDQFSGAGGDAQLVAGVTAVASVGAQRGDQAVLAERAEEGGGGAEHLGGPAHGVGGIVVIVELVGGAGTARGHSTSSFGDTSGGPSAVRRSGPELS